MNKIIKDCGEHLIDNTESIADFVTGDLSTMCDLKSAINDITSRDKSPDISRSVVPKTTIEKLKQGM